MANFRRIAATLVLLPVLLGMASADAKAPLVSQTSTVQQRPVQPRPAQQRPVQPQVIRAKAEKSTAQPAAQPRPWLYQNSDVPMDPAWQFGVLDNGLRYAIRRNGVPPGLISIRVRVDAGSLMEGPDERGFAHFIEHLTFRGSREVPDGEAKRVWQRLGATFGSDSNAQTTPTGTTYALDLPQAEPVGINQSMKILAGMMAAPNIVPEAVEAERAVILAEKRESYSPATAVSDEVRAFYFAGQPLAQRNPIGTTESLMAAKADALKAFHDRWYRPERVVIAVSGDVSPGLMERYIREYFGNWKPGGQPTPDPDFGKPDAAAPTTRVIVQPQAPTSVGMAWLRPWRPKADTIAYNQNKLIDALALQLINRRLEQAARAGASYIQAAVEQQEISRSADATFVTISPVGDDWQSALADVRAIIADAMATQPNQSDIDREYAAMDTAFAVAAENDDTESSASQAETMTGAVDIRETTVTAKAALDIFRGGRPLMTPAKMLESTRRMFTGTAHRALLIARNAGADDERKLAQAFSAPIAPASGKRLAAGSVTMDSLPALPPPGKVVKRVPFTDLNFERVTFANGVNLILFDTDAEKEKVRINVRFGNGQQSFGPDEDAALWAAPFVLAANGIGNLGQRELDELTNGRRMEFKFSVGEDAFELSAVSRPADYRDQLRLYAAKLAYPRWDAAPIMRLRAILNATESASRSSAAAVLDRELSWLLRRKDARFAPATHAMAQALTPEKFRAIWEPQLATGPIEVQIFGDIKTEEAIDAVARTFGALPPREARKAPSRNRKLWFPGAVATPEILRHTGATDQAAAVVAWPTGGGYGKLRDSRQLEVLAQIINDRLFERLRSIDGAVYSPTVASDWPLVYDKGGYFIIMAQLKPERLPLFGQMVRDIVSDLAANPVSEDELNRILVPMRKLLERATTSSAFWMAQTEGSSRDPRVMPAMRTYGRDLRTTTAADIRRLASRYLVASKIWSAIVLPQDVAPPAGLDSVWPGSRRGR